MESQPQLVLFPTVGYQLPGQDHWYVDVHGWCYDTNDAVHFQRTTANLLRRSLKIERGQPDPPFFRERAYGFVVDNKRQLPIEVTFPETQPTAFVTKRNGHYRGTLVLPAGLIETQATSTPHGSRKTFLKARRADRDVTAEGVIHLPDKRGLSVISDLDDTIKFSNVGNKRELLANTFIRAFRCIEGMPQVFQNLARNTVSFHYISASPWQLYGSVARFLQEQGFPEGSIHLRKFALKDATILKKIFPAHKKKRKVIEQLIVRFPERRYLLIGDSGEKDPEMYGEIARKFPEQIVGICIRNVTHDAVDSLRFRRAFTQIPHSKWMVYEDALRLQEHFLLELLNGLTDMQDVIQNP